MASDLQMIALDRETATLVEKRASERGLTAGQFIAALISRDEGFDRIDPNDLAVLEQRWAAIESGTSAPVLHGDVRRWLDTWGTPSFKTWSGSL